MNHSLLNLRFLRSTNQIRRQHLDEKSAGFFLQLKMSENVKSLLLLNSSKVNSSYSILFHCARYWAQQGNRVLFISKTPLKHLPVAVGKTNSSLNPDAFKLIQFMYLSTWQELLQQLYSIHLRHNPVSVIIVKSLENYFKCNADVLNCEDHTALICASLLHAISTCGKVIPQTVFLICEYLCEKSKIEKCIVKNFFHNIWQLKTDKDENEQTLTKLCRLSSIENNKIDCYVFNENLEESMLTFHKVIKVIINGR